MCVIFYAEDKAFIQDLNLERAWTANSDGAGLIALAPCGKLPMMTKGLMTLRAFEHALDMVPGGVPVAVHFRLKTHGAATAENTHPFRVGRDSYLMHNGVLRGLGVGGDKGTSDSGHLARILSRLHADDRVALLPLLDGKYILANNKGMTLVGDFTHQNNVWMSNTYWDYSGNHQARGGRCSLPQPLVLLPGEAPEVLPRKAINVQEWLENNRQEQLAKFNQPDEYEGCAGDTDEDTLFLQREDFLHPEDYYEDDDELSPAEIERAKAVLAKAMEDFPDEMTSGDETLEWEALEKTSSAIDKRGV